MEYLKSGIDINTCNQVRYLMDKFSRVNCKKPRHCRDVIYVFILLNVACSAHGFSSAIPHEAPDPLSAQVWESESFLVIL